MQNLRRLSTGRRAATSAVREPPVLLTVPEAADLLRTTPKAVYALVQRGQIAGLRRVGRRLLIHRRELLDSLAESRAPSPERTRR
jgi:excisionase family DNA binding protein